MRRNYKKIIYIISIFTLFAVIVGVTKFSFNYIDNNPKKYLPGK